VKRLVLTADVDSEAEVYGTERECRELGEEVADYSFFQDVLVDDKGVVHVFRFDTSTGVSTISQIDISGDESPPLYEFRPGFNKFTPKLLLDDESYVLVSNLKQVKLYNSENGHDGVLLYTAPTEQHVRAIGQGPSANSGYFQSVNLQTQTSHGAPQTSHGAPQTSHSIHSFDLSGTNPPLVIELNYVAEKLHGRFFQHIGIPSAFSTSKLRFMFDKQVAIVSFRYLDEANDEFVYYAFYRLKVSGDSLTETIQNFENWQLFAYVKSPEKFKVSDRAVAKNGNLILALSKEERRPKNVSFYMFNYENLIAKTKLNIHDRLGNCASSFTIDTHSLQPVVLVN